MGLRRRSASPYCTFTQGTRRARLGLPVLSFNPAGYSVAAPKAATSDSGQAANAEVMGRSRSPWLHKRSLTSLGAFFSKPRSDYGKYQDSEEPLAAPEDAASGPSSAQVDSAHGERGDALANAPTGAIENTAGKRNSNFAPKLSCTPSDGPPLDAAGSTGLSPRSTLLLGEQAGHSDGAPAQSVSLGETPPHFSPFAEEQQAVSTSPSACCDTPDSFCSSSQSPDCFSPDFTGADDGHGEASLNLTTVVSVPGRKSFHFTHGARGSGKHPGLLRAAGARSQGTAGASQGGARVPVRTGSTAKTGFSQLKIEAQLSGVCTARAFSTTTAEGAGSGGKFQGSSSDRDLRVPGPVTLPGDHKTDQRFCRKATTGTESSSDASEAPWSARGAWAPLPTVAAQTARQISRSKATARKISHCAPEAAQLGVRSELNIPA